MAGHLPFPRPPTPRTLYVYCGGWGVFHTLSAHLSDWSSPDYVNVYQHGRNYQNVYQIDYAAASDNQTLTVTLRKTGNEPGGSGSVDLKAAWLVGGGGAVLPTVKLTEPVGRRHLCRTGEHQAHGGRDGQSRLDHQSRILCRGPT